MPAPPPEQSWIDYKCSVRYEEVEGRTATHVPMSEREPQASAGGTGRVAGVFGAAAGRVDSARDKYDDAARRVGGALAPTRPAVANAVHEVQSPVCRVFLSGTAVRLGHHIPMPRLVSVGGVTAAHHRTHVWEEGVAAMSPPGLPIYGARWLIEYTLAEPPRGPLPTVANPFLGIDGEG